MDALVEWIIQHAHLAHWYIFGAIILAGLNIPVSADAMVIISALLASTVIPENTLFLFLSIFLGCYLSAMVSYWLGRLLGDKLAHFRWFAKILSKERLNRINTFYERHGFLTLLIGRFIPFGVRNGIFMTTGLSRLHFGKFIFRDFFACLTWSSLCFALFYKVGQNYQVLAHYVKLFNVVIFLAFSVTVIAFIWYKRKKKKNSKSEAG
jgi:membrane-associated protein